MELSQEQREGTWERVLEGKNAQGRGVWRRGRSKGQRKVGFPVPTFSLFYYISPPTVLVHFSSFCFVLQFLISFLSFSCSTSCSALVGTFLLELLNNFSLLHCPGEVSPGELSPVLRLLVLDILHICLCCLGFWI